MSLDTEDGVTDSGQRRSPLQARTVAPSFIWRFARTVLVLSACGLFAVVVARWLSDEGDVVSGPPHSSQGPSIVAEGIEHIVIRDKGRRVWEFAARKITISPDRKYAVATGMRRAILYRNEKPYLQLQASSVRLNQQTFDAEATGGVTASGPEGIEIRTERALWTQSRRVLQCPATVQVRVRGLTVQTRDVSYDMPQSRLHCPQRIEVQGPRISLRGLRAVVDVKNRRVEFNGGTEFVVKQPLE